MDRLQDLRVRQLDEALEPFQLLRRSSPPDQGWAKTIREALGMSLRQLGERTGLSKTSVRSAETHEARGSVQLDSLERLADGLGCVLVYALVPRDSLEKTIEDQAFRIAESLVDRVSDSMSLEAQAVAEVENERQKQGIAAEVVRSRGRDFWNVR